MTTMAQAKQQQDIISGIKNVAGLLRISTEKTDNTGKKTNLEKTLKNHKEKMLDELEHRQWNYTLYEEVLSGGTDYEDRPELQRLIAEIENYDAIVCMELTRLSRQGKSSQNIKHEVKKKGILIITLNPFKVYDMQNPQDSFLYDLSISMGEYEKELVSLRVKQNKISMAHQGLNSSGSVPFGYVRNPQTKKLEIETDKDGKETKAPIVRQIFKWYLEGIGQRTICDRLNEMGIMNKQGNKWVPNSLRYLLTCPTYKGTLVANNYVNEKGKQVVSEQVVVDNNHPAIIDVATWDKAQAFRKTKKERSGIDKRSKDWNSKKHMSILDGLIYCSCCGRKSTLKWYASKNNFYLIKCTRFDATGKTCNNGGISVKDIEKMVFERILSFKEQLEDKISKFSSNDFGIRLKELEDQKEMLQQSLNKLKVEMKVLNKMEMKYEMQKEMNGFEDADTEQMIAEDKQENQEQRMKVMEKLQEVELKLAETPSAETEINKLNEKMDIIKELQNNQELTVHQVNAMLKQVILKIDYKRELPENYRTLATKEKEKFPAQIEIEYLD